MNTTEVFENLKNQRISVIVPVFNEGQGILANLALLRSEITPHFSQYEIIVISDGSTDGTNEELRKISDPQTRVILLEKNQGKGAAVRRGFFEASGDYILFIDGGMELHPKEIRIFLGLMALYEADIVIGSKRHPQTRIHYPWPRRILSFIFQILIKRFFDLDVTDTQVGIKLFRNKVIHAVRNHLEINRYGFDIEVLALAKALGYGKMLEAPVSLEYFQKSQRNPIQEFSHVFRIGFHILKDTVQVYKKLNRLKAEQIVDIHS